MTPESKKIVLAALASHQGDDLHRAKAAFKGCTPQEMAEQYGQSGRTRQEILNEYQRHHDAVRDAIAEVKAI